MACGAFGRDVTARGLDADAAGVANLAQVGEEWRVVELVPLERKHAALWVGHVQMADMFPRLEDDRRIFLLAGEMIEVDQQLEVRVG